MSERQPALIIGGSRGVGLALVEEASRRNVEPVIVARTHTRPMMPQIPNLVADVSTEAGIEKVLLACETMSFSHVFWIAGAFPRGPLVEASDDDIDRALNMHQRQMVRFVREFHKQRLLARKNLPGDACYSLVVMGSTSIYKLRRDQTINAMAKAGQAAFARNFAAEMHEGLPGSRVILVNCDRIGVSGPWPGWPSRGRGLAGKIGAKRIDDGPYPHIPPRFVAKLVWDELKNLDRPYLELDVESAPEGPRVRPGPRTPKTAADTWE